MPQRDPKSLRQYETTLVVEMIEENNAALQKEIEDIRTEATKRGFFDSGVRLKKEEEARTNHLERIIKGQVRIRKDLAASAPELLEAGELDALLVRLEQAIKAHYQGRAQNRDRVSQASGRPVPVLYREDIETAQVSALARREVNKLKLSSELGITGTPERPMTLNIQNSTIGNLNLGDLVGDMNSTIEQLANRGHQPVAQSFKVLSEAVAQEDALGDKRKEILELISGLAEQANRPPQKRNQGIIKSLCGSVQDGLSVVANLSTLWAQHGETITGYFGL